MKNGQKLRCTHVNESEYLTVGKIYEVMGDYPDFMFSIVDDDEELVFQRALNGLHGQFEVVK